jgi:hypothetical protein
MRLHFETESSPQETREHQSFDLRLPASRIVRSKFLLFFNNLVCEVSP